MREAPTGAADAIARSLRSTSTYLRALAAIAGALSIVWGYLGLRAYLTGSSEFSSRPVDLLYYDFQLFVLSCPPLDDGGGRLPELLQIARFSAPAVTLYALMEAGRRLFATELARLNTRNARRHDIVCGDGPVARALSSRLRAQRRRVIRVWSGPGAAGRRVRSIIGDPTRLDVLRTAGVRGARRLYVCTADSATNLSIAFAAFGVRRDRSPALEVHVQVDDPELCLTLQARRLGMVPSPRLQVSFFNADELAARALLVAHPPPFRNGRPTRLMIVEASGFGMALAVELGRYWRLRDAEGPCPLEIVLVDAGATEAVVRLRRRYPFLADGCRFTTHDLAVARLLDGDLPDRPPDAVYLCCREEEVAVKLALTMDQFWHGGPRSVVVRLSRLEPMSRAFTHLPGDNGLLDDVFAALLFFEAVNACAEPAVIDNSLVERFAQAIHERYLLGRLRAGDRWHADRAMERWAELPEDLKASNRSQAEDVGRKLRAIGCAVAPSPVWGQPENLGPRDLERLATLEHERWCEFMRARGWRYGSPRDDAARRHPDLVDWAALDEPAREKDREAVRGIPHFLADTGFQIVRILPSPA